MIRFFLTKWSTPTKKDFIASFAKIGLSQKAPSEIFDWVLNTPLLSQVVFPVL